MKDKMGENQILILLTVQIEHVYFLMHELQLFSYMLTERTCCSQPHLILTSSAMRIMSVCVIFSADPFSSAMPSSLRYLSNHKQGNKKDSEGEKRLQITFNRFIQAYDPKSV